MYNVFLHFNSVRLAFNIVPLCKDVLDVVPSFPTMETHRLVCRFSLETLLIHRRTAVPLLGGNSRKTSLKHYFTPRYILSHVCLHERSEHTTPFYVRHAHPSRGLASCNTCHIIYVRVYRVTYANVFVSRRNCDFDLKHGGQ